MIGNATVEDVGRTKDGSRHLLLLPLIKNGILRGSSSGIWVSQVMVIKSILSPGGSFLRTPPSSLSSSLLDAFAVQCSYLSTRCNLGGLTMQLSHLRSLPVQEPLSTDPREGNISERDSPGKSNY